MRDTFERLLDIQSSIEAIVDTLNKAKKPLMRAN